MTDIIHTVARESSRLIPDQLLESVEPIYYRYQSWDANRKHEAPSQNIERSPEGPENILLIVIDCLRPDERPDLPLSFGTAVAPSSWTFPSVTSIHTGVPPHQHGSVAHTHPNSDEYALPEQTLINPNIPFKFEAAGYDTLSICSFMMPYLAIKGWYETHKVYQNASAEEVVSAYRSWRSNRQNTFAYLHFGDLHEPLTPPEQYAKRRNVDLSLPNLGKISEYTNDYDGSKEAENFREHRLRLYRSALDYLEDQLIPLLQDVRDDTLIVLCGDHGEAHWEHYERDRKITDSRPNYGVGHGGTPFDMVARVPIGTHAPDHDIQPQGGIPTLCDIPKTLSSVALESSPKDQQSWLDQIPKERHVICEGSRYGVERKASYMDNYKIIYSKSDNILWSCKINREYGERFTEIPSDIQQDLVESLPDYWEDFDMMDKPNEMVKSQLEALGYK